ncbi:HAD family hydrolase [Pseudomonas sp. F1_0610]|uniref:HAD family hydrolase n=1 Tax=Pseudomonas sp. F1_0610 TaxID=3114284 RepID=UPI0039C2F5A4
MRWQAVLFDLDGTLMDTALDFISIAQQMRVEHGLPEMPAPRIREVISGGAAAIVETALEISESDSAFEALRQEFLKRYQTQCAVHTSLFAGMKNVLTQLEQAGIIWGIATNKPVRYAEPILQQLDLEQRCAVLMCPEHVENSKPAPDMLLKACEILQVEPQKVLYIGDDQRDIQAAEAAGMYSIAARYGYIHPQDNPDNWGANAVINQPQELLAIIERTSCSC